MTSPGNSHRTIRKIPVYNCTCMIPVEGINYTPKKSPTYNYILYGGNMSVESLDRLFRVKTKYELLSVKKQKKAIKDQRKIPLNC